MQWLQAKIYMFTQHKFCSQRPAYKTNLNYVHVYNNSKHFSLSMQVK